MGLFARTIGSMPGCIFLEVRVRFCHRSAKSIKLLPIGVRRG
jgi:hypothetical protein